MANGTNKGFLGIDWSNVNWQNVGGFGGAGMTLAGLLGSAFQETPKSFGAGVSQMKDYLRRLNTRYGEVESRSFNPLTDPGVRGARGAIQSQIQQAQAQTGRTLAQRGLSSTGLGAALNRQTQLEAGRQMGQVTAQRATSFEQWKDQLMQSLLSQIGSGTATLAQLYGQQAQMEAQSSPWSTLAGLGGTLLGSAIGMPYLGAGIGAAAGSAGV